MRELAALVAIARITGPSPDLSPGEVKAVSRLIKEHRVVNQSLANLRTAGDHAGVQQVSLLPEFRSAIHARQQRPERFRRLACLLRDAGVAFLVIKGVGMEALYPAGSCRDGNDFDIVVPDEHQFWSAYHALRCAGLDVAGYPCLIKYGTQYALETVLDDEKEEGPSRLSVNILAGRYPTGLYTMVDDDLFRNPTEAVYAETPFLTPQPEQTVILLAAHVHTTMGLQMKDLNDLFVLVNSGQADPDRCFRAARCLGLDDALHTVWTATRYVYPDMSGPASDRRSRASASAVAVSRPTPSLVWESLRLQYRHGVKLHGQRLKAAFGALDLGWRCLRSVGVNLEFILRRRVSAIRQPGRETGLAPGKMLVLDEVADQTCVPPGSSGAGVQLTPTLTWYRLQGRDAVVSPAGVFAAAMGASPTDRHVRKLSSVMARSAR